MQEPLIRYWAFGVFMGFFLQTLAREYVTIVKGSFYLLALFAFQEAARLYSAILQSVLMNLINKQRLKINSEECFVRAYFCM